MTQSLQRDVQGLLTARILQETASEGVQSLNFKMIYQANIGIRVWIPSILGNTSASSLIDRMRQLILLKDRVFCVYKL